MNPQMQEMYHQVSNLYVYLQTSFWAGRRIVNAAPMLLLICSGDESYG
jgi:hypothetical protein